VSVKRVTNVEFSVSEEAALTIKALLYRLNWSQFDFASQLAYDIENLEISGVDVSIDFNYETEEFDRV
jgi:hypothetical protein